MNTEINELIDQVTEQAQNIIDDAPKAKAGNKAAARRMRKATLELGNRCGKEFRAKSVHLIG